MREEHYRQAPPAMREIQQPAPVQREQRRDTYREPQQYREAQQFRQPQPERAAPMPREAPVTIAIFPSALRFKGLLVSVYAA